MITKGNNKTCEYFDVFFKLGSGDNDGEVGYFSKKVVCDNYGCKNNNGKFYSAELDDETGFCDTNGGIEGGIPVGNNGGVLEETLTKSELRMGKDFAGIK